MWTVYGMTIDSSPGSLSGYLNTYHFSLTIRNTGVDPLTGLVIQASSCLIVTGRLLQNTICKMYMIVVFICISSREFSRISLKRVPRVTHMLSSRKP